MYGNTQAIFDKELAFSSAQVIDNTANVASTNEIDLGGVNMGKGTPIKVVVNVTAISGTLTIKVAQKATASVAVTDDVMVADVTPAAVGQYHFTLPQNVLRYVKLFYTAGTSATITAYLTAEINN